MEDQPRKRNTASRQTGHDDRDSDAGPPHAGSCCTVMTTALIICSICIVITALALSLSITSFFYFSGLEKRLKDIEVVRANDNKVFDEIASKLKEISTNQADNTKHIEKFEVTTASLKKEISEIGNFVQEFEKFDDETATPRRKISELEQVVREVEEKLKEDTHKNELLWKDSGTRLQTMDVDLDYSKKRMDKNENESAALKQKISEFELLVNELKEKLQETSHKNELMLKDSDIQTTALVIHVFGLLETEKQKQDFCRSLSEVHIPSISELGYCAK